MDVDSVFITGANRGIGLEFVKQLVKLPKPPRLIFATYRNRDTVKPLEEVKDATKNCQILLIKMDITKQAEIKSARKIVEDMVGDRGLTLLINNAAVLKAQGFPDVTEENMLYHFTTNTIGTINVLKEMQPLLRKAAGLSTEKINVSRAAVLNISAGGASITWLHPDHPLDILGYRTSKTALNMAMAVIALEIKDQGILMVQMCPGWVKTEMGGSIDLPISMGGRNVLIEVAESISTMLQTLPLLNESHHGAFLDRKGTPIPF